MPAHRFSSKVPQLRQFCVPSEPTGLEATAFGAKSPSNLGNVDVFRGLIRYCGLPCVGGDPSDLSLGVALRSVLRTAKCFRACGQIWGDLPLSCMRTFRFLPGSSHYFGNST